MIPKLNSSLQSGLWIKHILEYMKDNIPNYHRLEINPHPDQYTEFIDNILIFEYLKDEETFPEVIKKYIPYE